MKKIFFFLAALMLTFTAQATIVECNPGTNNLAWYLTQGDTLVLADGIYEEAYSIDFNKLGVCVKAAEGAKPVIKLTGEYTVLDVQATTTFEGITFDAGNVAKYLVATTGVNPGTLTINNCEFRNWTYWALSNQFEETASIDSVIVNNTIFHDGAEAAISFNNKAPEGLHSCNYFSLTNSTIYNVKSTEYAGIVHVSSNGEATGKQNTIIIDHVTMYNLDGADLGIIAVRKSSNLTISNTIIANPAEGERASYVYGGVAENVIYYNVSQDGDLTYTNCLTDDPKFVDATNGNFALAEGSPALTAGTDGKAIGDPRWNVVAEPEPVVYNVTVTAENGTVEGAGEYEEGTTATLTATANEGYEFVNWTVGEEVVSTENPYTFTVTADVALVANFELIPVVEPEKPEPTYTENQLNPFAFGLESKLSADKETLTVTYRLNNSKATSVNVIVYNGEEVIATVPGTTTIGKNTVEVPTADLPGGVELTWSVEVNGKSVAAPTREEKIYSFFHPSSVDVDNNPENPTFGMLLVNEAMQKVKTSTKPYVSVGFGAGIFAFTPSFDLMPNGELPGYNGGINFTTGRYDDSSATAYAPRRIRISDDGRIFVTSLNTDGNYLWEVNPENMNEWTPIFKGARNDKAELVDAESNFIAAPNVGFDVKGSGENLQLLMLSSNLNGFGFAFSGYQTHEYNLGTATEWTTTPSKKVFGGKYVISYTSAQVEYDNEGGVWICQNRSTATDAQPSLIHINAAGEEDYKEVLNSRANAGIRFNHDFSKLIIATSGKKATIYAVSKDANDAPVLTEEVVIDMSAVGTNLNDFAYDYAGNLYACGNSSEKLAAWAMPYSGTVETPASSKYAFELDYNVMDITMTNLEVQEMGELVVLTASDDENTGLNVRLAVNADGSLAADSYMALVQGWSETELPIVEGTITKTYSEELATDVYAGLVVVLNNGAKLGLNLTMYAGPAIDVVIENATITVEEKSDGVGGTYELINVSAPWGESTLVIEGIEKNHKGFVQIKEIFIVDGEEDWYIWMCQDAVVATVDDVLTVTGKFKNKFVGATYNVTISGTLPQGPGTALENATVTIKSIKMIKNNQLIIRKGDVEYNANGQLIK